MSKGDLKKTNIPAYRRAIGTTRAPPPTSLGTYRKIKTKAAGNFFTPSLRFTKGLKRSKSEPSIWEASAGDTAKEEEELYLPWTYTNVFSSPEVLWTQSLMKFSQGYNKDSKVVVNVTVEGSPGPIRTMVKLGSDIDETIKLVINKYNDEGRTPRLEKDAASMCELHHSYFSLECLNKSDVIGDVGSRSFYLRKSSCSRTASSDQLAPLPQLLLPSLIDRKIKKIVRRTQKLWRILGCIS